MGDTKTEQDLDEGDGGSARVSGESPTFVLSVLKKRRNAIRL